MSEKHQVCRLCLRERELRRSHVLPEFLYAPLYSDDHKLIKVETASAQVEKIQKGLRERLLCGDCEQHLNDVAERRSAPAWRAIASGESEGLVQIKRVSSGEIPYYGLEVKGIDYHGFKLLLLSILWRASVASDAVWDSISLGPHEEEIRQMLLSGTPGPDTKYPCWLARVVPQSPRLVSVADALKLEGHRIYELIISPLLLWVMVSSHAYEGEGMVARLRQEGEMLVAPFHVGEVAQLGKVTRELKRIARLRVSRKSSR